MKPLPRFAAGALVCLASCSLHSAATAAVVTAGKHFLTPNAAGQQVAILVSGGDAVAGIDFFIQVGDGGATVGGVDTGPTITGVDLLTGAIFAANHTTVFLDPAPLIWGATTTTVAGTVPAAGRLATLTIDTTGFFTGRYDLILNPPATGPTQLAGATTNLVGGWLHIGPPDAGDFTEDGDVNAADFAAWKLHFGAAGSATHMQGDANGDHDVDAADFLVWQQQFNGNLPGAAPAWAPVPEPGGQFLLAVALTAALTAACRRRPRRPA